MTPAIAALLWVLVLGLPGTLRAGGGEGEEPEAVRPGVVVAEVLEVKGRVEAIDPARRWLTLQGPRNRPLRLKVAPGVKRFDQVRKGDTVAVGFLESVAVAIQTGPSRANAPPVGRLVSVAPKANAGVYIAETFRLDAVLEAVDRKGRLLTVRGGDGGLRVVPVFSGIKRLESLRKGQTLALWLTEPIAIRIERGK